MVVVAPFATRLVMFALVVVEFVVVVLPNIELLAKRFSILAFVIEDDAAVVVEKVEVALNVAGDPVVRVPDTYRLVVVAFVKFALFAVSPVDDAVTAPLPTLSVLVLVVVAFVVDA